MPLWLAGLIAVLGAAAWIFGKWKRWRGAAALINRAAAPDARVSKKIWQGVGALLFLSALSYILLAYILFAGID